MRGVAVGQGRQRGHPDVRRHIGAEHDREEGAVVRAGRGQAAGRRGHVQLGGRVQARPGDTAPVQVPIELQRFQRNRSTQVFPGGGPVRTAAASSVSSIPVPQMEKNT